MIRTATHPAPTATRFAPTAPRARRTLALSIALMLGAGVPAALAHDGPHGGAHGGRLHNRATGPHHEAPRRVHGAPRAESLLPLPPASAALRLQGERAAVSWSLPLTAAQAIDGVTLRLVHTSALAVAPELSTLDVRVNGVPVVSEPIDAPDGARLDIALPADALEVGYNRLTVAVRQRHRLFCTADAAHELWTEIDAARTGLVNDASTRGASAFARLADLTAVKRLPDGGVLLRIVGASSPGDAGLTDAFAAARRVVAALGYRDVRVAWGDADDAGPKGSGTAGLHLALDDAASEPLIAVAGGVPTLTVGAAAFESDAWGALERERPASQAVAFLAPPSGDALRARAVPLSRFGLEDERFVGRRYENGFDLRLPSDARPADYGDAELDLAFAHGEGLVPGAAVLVRVNGVPRATVPLTSRQARVYRRKTLQIPFGAFRAGINRVSVEALLPHDDDGACDPLARIDAAPRFAFSAASTLRLPSMARVTQTPDLASLLDAGAGGDAPLDVVIPDPSPAALAAAATFLIGLDARADAAQAVARAPARVRTDTVHPDPDAHTVLVAALHDLPVTLASRLPGVTHGAVAARWGFEPPALAESPTRHVAMASVKMTSVEMAAVKGGPDPLTRPLPRAEDVLDSWSGTADDAPSGAFAQLERRLDALHDAMPDLSGALTPNGAPPGPATLADPGDALLVRLGNARNGTTVLTAATADDLVLAARAVSLDGAGQRVAGTAVAVDRGAEGLSVRSAAGSPSLAPTSFGLGNIRLIAAAWLSENTAGYAALLIGFLALAGLSAGRLLPRVGQRADGERP